MEHTEPRRGQGLRSVHHVHTAGSRAPIDIASAEQRVWNGLRLVSWQLVRWSESRRGGKVRERAIGMRLTIADRYSRKKRAGDKRHAEIGKSGV